MKRLMHNAHVLVVDGAHALLLQNAATPPRIDLKLLHERSQFVPPTHALGSEAPPRTNDSMGRRSAMEVPDYHQRQEDAFVASVVDEMAAAFAKGDIQQIAVVAPPAALAVLRKHWPPALAKITVCELDKDLTRHSPRQIGESLGKALEAWSG